MKPTPKPRMPRAMKYQGYVIWVFVGGDNDGSAQKYEIKEAISRDDGNELVIDCDCAQPGEPSYVYTISLRRESPLTYRGEWAAGKNGPSTGTCSCRVYTN
jgi:hypothetical protein